LPWRRRGQRARLPPAQRRFSSAAGQGLMRRTSTQSNGQLDMLALRCIFGIFLWFLTRQAFQGIGTEQWVPFVPAMKLGDGLARRRRRWLSWQQRCYRRSQRRARVWRAGELKSNKEQERRGRRRELEEEERACAVGSRSCDSRHRSRNRRI
jgi:hypothetical protein